MPVVEQNGVFFSVDRDRPATTQLADIQAVEMVVGLAQVSTCFVDVAFEQVGNGHA